MKWGICLLFVLCMVVGLYGCVGSRPYQIAALGARPTKEGGRLDFRVSEPAVSKVCSSPGACVMFVEFDDYGNLMNRAQMQSAVNVAKKMASNNGTVLVYVHGWHNDAKNGTRDVEEFKNLVQRLSEIDKEFRPDHPGSGQFLGIYVGWRGDSIPSDGVLAPLSYTLTFWDRKNAAHNIGSSGGVYELFSRLSDLRRDYPRSRLLIHGHSFGGALVYSTLSHTIMDQIRRDGVEDSHQASPVADLILVVNPAFEAMKLRPQFDLARSQEYKPSLPPRLVILTTTADSATRLAFPIGRFFGTLAASYADDQSSSQNKLAIGHYLPYVTHQLAPSKPGNCTAMQGVPVQSLEAVQSERQSTLCIHPLVHSDAKPLELRRCDQPGWCADVAENHYIARGAVVEGFVPYRLPILNIRTTSEVSSGHSDIRNKTLENFVIQLMALAVRDPNSVPMAPLPNLPNQ